MTLYRELLQELENEKLYPVYDMYSFGSLIYGTHTKTSDFDFVVICDSNVPEVELTLNKFNVHITHKTTFQRLLNEHNIGAIEQFMSPIQYNTTDLFKFDLNHQLLRQSISKTVSNSWAKCFKKIRQGDYDIGIKSMFHSLRIILFGIQLAKYHKIVDWSVANDIFDRLNSKTWNEQELKNEFQEYRNKLLTEFRLLAGK